MRDVLSRVAIGPAGSRDLTREEARSALAWVLAGDTSEVQAAVFLIAERLKRETEEENLGFLDALVDASDVRTTRADEVLCLADPFDGFLRGPHYAPVVAGILAACGMPSYVTGCQSLAPKHGWTHRQVLEAMGLKVVATSVEDSVARLDSTGVSYLDVETFCPPLHQLGALREEIAKRPFLATLEKLIMPLRGATRTHLVGGWVHAGYETLLQRLARDQGAHSVLLVKGREGHVDPHVHRITSTVGIGADERPFSEEVEPKGYGVLLGDQPSWETIDASTVASMWDEALHPKLRTHPGQTVRLLSGLALCRSGRASTTMRGVGMAHQAIVGGAAREKLLAFGD